MAKIKIVIRKQKLSNGGYPITLRLAHKKLPTTFISLGGLYVNNVDEWNNVLSRFTPKKPDYKILNKELTRIENEADVVLSRLIARNAFSYHRFKSEYLKKDDVKLSVFNAYNQKIKSLMAVGNIGNALSYKTSLAALKKFTKDIFFSDIDFKLLQDFGQFCEERGSKGNTIHLYFRGLRAIHYNYCKQKNLSKPTVYERFNISKFKKETSKRSLNEQQLKYILDNQLPKLSFSRDIFLFSFLCRGANIRDIALLTKSNVENGVIIYRRSKTGRMFSISLTQPLKELIDKYSSESKYLFPILSERCNTPEKIQARIKNANKSINRGLKKYGDKIGIDNLTSYFARHTWANLARQNGVGIELISSGLGHSDLKTTEIYLSGFANEKLDEITSSIVNNL